MDRRTNAEVGGPYASHEDAQRAIERGNFDQDPAELSVSEGDGGGDTSREAARTAAWGPYETPTTGGEPGPSTPEVPELGQPVPDGGSMPRTTKPAQTPGGSGGLPQDPMSPHFDSPMMGPSSSQTPPPADPLASATAAVVEEIRAANPGLSEEALIRVASKAVARLVQADFNPYAEMVNIEDPLAGSNPGKTLQDLTRSLRNVRHPLRPRQPQPESRQPQPESQQPEEEREGQGRLFEPPGQGTLFDLPDPPEGSGSQEPQEQEGPGEGQGTLFGDPEPQYEQMPMFDEPEQARRAPMLLV